MLVGLILSMVCIPGFSQEEKFFNQKEIRIGNAWFNTSSSEIGPAIVENQLIFNSGNLVGSLNEKKGKSAGSVFYDLYTVNFDNLGTFSADLTRMSSVITRHHEGPLSYCAKSRQLFITQSMPGNPDIENVVFKKENVRLGISIYNRTPAGWELADNFPFNNQHFSIAHPAVSITGDTLVFASDKHGGIGGVDLYYSVKKMGYWSEPENLGEKINTPGNDMFPFLDGDGALVFASDGRNGFGGLDLFFVQDFSSPDPDVMSLGEDFNSAADDFGLVIEPKHRFGFFVSNRDGGSGDDDIYYFKAENYSFKLAPVSALSKRSLPGAKLQVFDNRDNLVAEGFADEQGLFSAKLRLDEKYHVIASMSGYKDMLYELNLTGEDKFVDKKEIIPMQPLYQLDGEVIDLVEKVPLSDALVLLMQGGQLQDTLRVNTDGEFSVQIQPDQEYYVNVSKDHYINSEINFSTIGISEGAIFHLFELYPMKTGTRIVLNNMEFSPGSFELLPEASRELNRLVIVLIENPDLRIRLEAHTDSRGDDQSNLILSQNRAETVYNYLVANGIDPVRMEYIGLGETQLVNECDDGVYCTEGQHAQNRRIVVEIL